MIRLIFVSLLLAACTPAVPAGTSQTSIVAPSVAGVTPVPATLVPATPVPSPPTTAPSTHVSTPRPAQSCDPVYYDCEDKYTPRPPASAAATATAAAATPTGPAATPEPAGGELVVGTSEDGSYLVSPDGMALYTFANDSPGTSTCYGECAQAWPALTVEPNQQPVGGEGVEGTFATTTRDDGTKQVTYNDAPLYSYEGDTAVGHTNGHGIAGVWFVAEP